MLNLSLGNNNHGQDYKQTFMAADSAFARSRQATLTDDVIMQDFKMATAVVFGIYFPI